MDKIMLEASIKEFLSFIGSGRPPSPAIAWNLPQLQYARLCFGMSGEDVILFQYFKRDIASGRKGAYVDVGACRASQISNTYLFYLLGWRGLCIDAAPRTADEWRLVRPGDAFENVAVSDTPGSVYWWKHSAQLGMSQITGGEDDRPGPEYSEEPIATKAERLDTLFSRHFADREIDFMSIDIEGSELAALRSNDWNRWRPKIIVMEDRDFDMVRPMNSPTVSFLLAQGYKLDGKVAANVIMVNNSL